MKRIMAIVFFLGLVALATNTGCGGSGSAPATAVTPPAAPVCTIDTDCNDGNALTLDDCGVDLGTNQAVCVNTPIACNTSTDCDDANTLTTDTCSGGGTAGAACSNTPVGIACTVNSDCDDADALTIDACANGGTLTAACAHVAIACNIDTDCNDSNGNTIDTCSNGGAVAAACANTVSRTMWVQVTAVNPVDGNVPVSGATVEVVNPDGSTTYAGNTNTSGVVEITGRSAGNHTVSISQNPGSVPHFVVPTSQILVIDATSSATATLNVTPRYDVNVVVRKDSDHQALLNATVDMYNSQYPVTVTATVDGSGIAHFTDVIMGIYTATITNPEATTPILVARETQDITVQVYRQINTGIAIIDALQTACYDGDANGGGDDDCEIDAEGNNIIPMGMTVSDCWGDPGGTAANCRYQ